MDLWEKYKEIMGKDISMNCPLDHTMCDAEKESCVINEVLLCLQEEFEGMGSSLEVFGLSKPQLGIPCAEGTKNNIRGNVLC